MFAGDEKGPAVVDVTQKVARTKIAVFDPQITRLHRLEQRAEQASVPAHGHFHRERHR